MTFTTGRGVNLIELREALKLRPMAEFDPSKPARVYDNLNERLFDWKPENAERYRQTARPYKDRGYEELTNYDGRAVGAACLKRIDGRTWVIGGNNLPTLALAIHRCISPATLRITNPLPLVLWIYGSVR